ncbi:MAG TPA: hypothetical protein VNL17_04225 [Verrucomicrobiae bacterium]|nr:hypothetical protein [Verrucomicrobiae bacterium]
MKKLLWIVPAVLVILLVVLFLSRNVIARVSVEYGAKKVTGFPLEIGSVDVGLFSGKVDVRDLKLMNPPEFQEKMFVDMPQLYVDYRLGSMLSGAPHINDMLINIKQLVIVKTDKGDSNAMKLKGVVSSGGGSKSSTKYQVDQLRIQVGTVTIKDYSRAKPTERTLTLNLQRTYKNISDSTDITRLVLLTIAGNVPLPEIGIKPEDLKKGLGNVTDAAGETLKGVTEQTKGLFDNLKKALPQQDNK